MQYYSAIKKNVVASVPRRWMILDPIIQSEVSHKKKKKKKKNTNIVSTQFSLSFVSDSL